MIPQDGYTDLAVARLFDFVYRRSPWQRRLWRIGLVLSLREVIEYSRLVEQGLSDEGLNFVAQCVLADLDRDAGVPEALADILRTALRDGKIKSPETRDRVEVLANRIEHGYLAAWRQAADRSDERRPSVEHVARAVASFLLDSGFSSDHLHRWLRSAETAEEPVALPELFDSAIAMSQNPETGYRVLVPFEQLPNQPLPAGSSFERLDGSETAQSLRKLKVDTSHVRYSSALLFEVHARDPWGAVDRAGEMVSRLQARATVGHPGESKVRPAGVAYLSGRKERFTLSQPRRQVEVHSVTRQGALFDVANYRESGVLDDALELAATMEHGAPGAAVAGGWAAIEGLLSRPGTRGDAPLAADRLAGLIAASWPRAELTTVSYRHDPLETDDLSARLAVAGSNRERCLAVEEHLRMGGRMTLRDGSDRAAEAHA